MKGEWIKEPQGQVAVVFVHGVLSSGESCWRNKNGCFWPDLLEREDDLDSLGIYVFTYQTGIFSGGYSLSDVVDNLKEHLILDQVLDRTDKLVFVCHSMGGIVARKFVLERQADLIEEGKKIGLFLVASPSLGSSYADWLAPLSKFMGHAQADALRFVRDNYWLQDLDKRFINLKEAGILEIQGKELVEDKFVILKKIWRRQVVEPFAGARYFGEAVKIPQSDHFSIAKPEDQQSLQHRLLCRFIYEFAPESAGAVEVQAEGTNDSVKILFLAAAAGVPLDLRSEVEKINDSIAKSPQKLEVIPKFDVAKDDFLVLLNECRPRVVHFSGNMYRGSLYLSEMNEIEAIPEDALVDVLASMKEHIRLVVLNACHSGQCAQAVAEIIEVAIGIDGEISDQSAIIFSQAFYLAIAHRVSVQNAYEQGIAAINFRPNAGTGNEQVPEIFCRKGIDARNVYIVDQ